MKTKLCNQKLITYSFANMCIMYKNMYESWNMIPKCIIPNYTIIHIGYYIRQPSKNQKSKKKIKKPCTFHNPRNTKYHGKWRDPSEVLAFSLYPWRDFGPMSLWFYVTHSISEHQIKAFQSTTFKIYKHFSTQFFKSFC